MDPASLRAARHVARGGADALARAVVPGSTAMMRTLRLLAAAGRVDALEAICDRADFSAADLIRYRFDDYVGACGSISVLEWLRARGASNTALLEGQLVDTAAAHGRIGLLAHMRDHMEVDAGYVVETLVPAAAAEAGRVDVLEWLRETYDLDATDIRRSGNAALRLAAEGGSVEALDWLYRTFGLTPADVGEAEVVAAAAGHAGVLAWARGLLGGRAFAVAADLPGEGAFAETAWTAGLDD